MTKSMKNRMQALVISAATIAGTMALAAPASAMPLTYGPRTTYTYTYRTNTYNWQALQYWLQAMGYQQPATAPVMSPAPAPVKRTTPAPMPSKPAASAPAPTQSAPVNGLTAEEQQMLTLVNQERSKAGVAPLKADLQLTKTARLKSQDMINLNYFSHQSPTYGSPFDMMKSYGISYRSAGENIAGNQSVAKAHSALMNSAGHRANILNSSFTSIGIGIVHGGQYGVMFTQQFKG